MNRISTKILKECLKCDQEFTHLLKEIGTSKTNLYYHINKLEKQGLIKIIGKDNKKHDKGTKLYIQAKSKEINNYVINEYFKLNNMTHSRIIMN